MKISNSHFYAVSSVVHDFSSGPNGSTPAANKEEHPLYITHCITTFCPDMRKFGPHHVPCSVNIRLQHLPLIKNDLSRIHLGDAHFVNAAVCFREHGLNNHWSRQRGIHRDFSLSGSAGQTEVESTDDGVGVVDSNGSNVGKGLDLLRPRSRVSLSLRNTARPCTYTTLTWSSVMDRPSWPTRVLTAFQPVSREAKWT